MRLAPVLLAAALLVPACGDGPDSDDKSGGGSGVRVAAGFYPLEVLAREVGGPRVRVVGLATPGAEPHDLELTPRQVAEVADADLVLHLRGVQPALDAAVEQQAEAALDLATVQPLEQGFVPVEDGELHEDEKGADPHVWLDPQRFAALAAAVEAELVRLDPAGAEGYRTRSAALRRDLDGLHQELRQGLSGCARTDLVTSHNAFGYLARAYGLRQIAITGLTPEAEPTPGRLAEVTRLARARGVTTVFFESLVSPKVAEALAREIGARADVLDPLESAPASGGYVEAMRGNLDRLRTALGCR